MLKKKLSEKQCFGLFSKSTDSAIVEATGYAGVDFIILDTEHGPSNLETLQNHVRAAKNSGLSPIIRTKDNSSHSIGSALDTGADGVQVPNVSTAEQALAVVKNARFYPFGERGVCRFVKAANYGLINKEKYFKDANEKLLILQIEGSEGVNNLDSILEVAGIDVIFIGPYDLSQSLGVPGDIESDIVTEKIKQIILKAKAKNIYVGCFTDTRENMSWLKSLNVNYIAYSVDINIYQEKLLEIFNCDKQ
jgi:4-hydroxy-2-oxoheptanedioate aldolase